MAFMAGQRGRGAFLSNVQILNSLTAIGTSALIALSLSRYQGSLTYALLLAGGVVLGIIGSLILLGLPEPEEYRPPEGSSLGKTIRAAFKDGNFRRYVWVLCPLAFAAGTARTFIVTHARALYGQSDGMVMLYSVAFNLGIVFMGFLSRRLMDRLGAKPLYAVFGAIAALAMLPLVWSPLLDGGLSTTLFLLAVNFLAGFGIAGQENAGQAYFFSIIGRDQVMDLAVVYFVVLGLGGTLGSALGGVFLDALSSAGVPAQLSYRLLYSTVLVIIALASMGIGGLASLGSASVRQSLGVMFNLRDLKAISLLDRLGKTRSPLEEAEVIREIGSRGSALSEAELLPYLANPRFDLRVEALLALENLDRLSQKTLTALCG